MADLFSVLLRVVAVRDHGKSNDARHLQVIVRAIVRDSLPEKNQIARSDRHAVEPIKREVASEGALGLSVAVVARVHAEGEARQPGGRTSSAIDDDAIERRRGERTRIRVPVNALQAGVGCCGE